MNPESKPSRVSMRDIARKLGVSHATVSCALRDHPRISVAMRKLVRETAEEMGYRPDPLLTSLIHYRKDKKDQAISSGIAWINAWEDPEKLRTYKEFDLYWKGASAAAEKFGYRLEEFRFGGEFNSKRLHQILSTRYIRGILIPPHRKPVDWEDFPWSEYSVVRFGRSVPDPRCHLVTADHVSNTILAFEKIQERGYRRIGFITDETEMLAKRHLFESGFLTAQRFVDESERVPVFVANAFPKGEQQKALGKWFKKHKPDAIITNMAEAPAMLATVGLRVPADVALAGTSTIDIPISAGIDQQPEEIGRVGFLMLNSQINDNARGIPRVFRQNLVEGSWVDGDSLPDRSR